MSNNGNIPGAFKGLELVGPERLNLRRAGDNFTYKATGRVDHLSSLVPSCGAFCNTEAITRGFGWGE